MKTKVLEEEMEYESVCQGCKHEYNPFWDKEPCKSCEVPKPTNYEPEENELGAKNHE